MNEQTKEKAFEAYIEEVLLGQSGWKHGTNKEWDAESAIFPDEVIRFLKDSQSDRWQQMVSEHGADFESKLLISLCKELDTKGALHVLRHGFKFYGKIFRMAYFKPAHGLNPEVIELYLKNCLTVTRQVPYNPDTNETIDLVFAVNGLPVATCELKNPATGQDWADAVQQYNSRDHRKPILGFKKRALVHFAVDPNEVYMTTRVIKGRTHFLPFNRGSHPGDIKCGAGNPQHSSGHRTGYFWEDVLARDSFLDILGSFMFIEKSDEKVDDGKGGKKIIKKETMIFPRYHQLDSVRKLVAAAGDDGVGDNYLIQHSAGSGKTNSISWLSHRLASLHDKNDKTIYDCVVVITDRKVLDQQLQDAIYQIEHAQGVVQAIDEDAKQLAEALVDGTKIVITTLQKFPFVLKGLLHIAGAKDADKPDTEAVRRRKDWLDEIAKKRYAIIVDEAHSSQTGETSRELKEILGTGTEAADETEANWEDNLNRIMESRGRQKNLSFFAFTATPKGKTLELFGTLRGDKPEAFHVYSMRQAIEERFIKDVLKHYTTYKTYFRLVKFVEDDPEYPKKKATQALAKFMNLHPHNIEQKTEIIIEHFRKHVKHQMAGRAKAMLVTSSRINAVRYMLAFQRYIEDNSYTDVRPLVAFSGTVKDPDTDLEYTEPGMNKDVVTGKSISEAQLPEKFKTSDYQILLVANKYQTGFDQPLLHTMYVDKRLAGVQAVQTLSRLNRIFPGKEDPFILDFVNEPEEIYYAFKPYYDTTSLQETSDPQQLEAIKHELDGMQIYYWSEVEAFARVFYKPVQQQATSDNARMDMHLQPAVDRYNAIEDDEKQQLFYDRLSGYVKLYSFLSQIMPYSDSDLEMLHSYGKFLLPHLRKGRDVVIIRPDEKVDLEYYRLQRVYSGAIELDDGNSVEVKSPTDVATGKANEDKKPLSDIIEVVNERFGTDFTDEDRLFFEQIKEKACADDHIIKTAIANTLDKFEIGVRKPIIDLMIQRMAENDRIVSKFMDDKEFQGLVYPLLAKEIFMSVNEKAIE